LSQCAPVADLAARGREVDRLSRRIVGHLPVPLREHVSHAGLRHDRVVLLVQSSVWAARARMEHTRILAAVQSLGLTATSLTAKVALPPRPLPDAGATRPVTPKAAHAIRTAAAAIADPELRARFLELAGSDAT
jgi:hypothetical protein